MDRESLDIPARLMMAEDECRQTRPTFWGDLKKFRSFARYMPLWQTIREVPAYAKYMAVMHGIPVLQAIVQPFLPVPKEDEVSISGLNVTDVQKLWHDGVVHQDVGDLTLEGFEFSDYVAKIEGRVGFRSRVLKRHFPMLWHAELVQKRWASFILRDVVVCLRQPGDEFPYSRRDFGLTWDYSERILKRVRHNYPIAWGIVGDTIKTIDREITDYLMEEGLVDELFEREMDHVSFHVELDLKAEDDSDKTDLLDCLENGGSIPPRLLYKGEGARHFLKIVASKTYRTAGVERKLLEKMAPDIMGDFEGPVTIIDMGCGDGTKAELLLECSPGKSDYRPIDVSPTFMYMALKMESRHSNGDEPTGVLTSFEKLSKLPGGNRRLLLMLGNTCSNFEDQAALLSRIESLMDYSDRLLVGFENYTGADEAVSEYDDGVSRDLAFNPLRENFGLDPEDFNYSPEFNRDLGRVELVLTPKKPIEVEYKDRAVELSPESRIVAHISGRTDSEDFLNTLEDAGLEALALYSEGGYSLALAGKRQYRAG